MASKTTKRKPIKRATKPEAIDEFGLTLKQRRFADEYLMCGNGTRAARKAGYKGNAITLAAVAYENLRKPQIVAYIRERLKAAAMEVDEVLWRLTEQARNDAAQYVKAPAKGDPYIDVAAMVRDGKAHLIRGINYSRTGRLIVETHDAQSALVQMGRHYGLFVDKTALTDPTGQKEFMQENADSARGELARRISRLAAAGGEGSGPGKPDAGTGAGTPV